jgi:hypothetical protein
MVVVIPMPGKKRLWNVALECCSGLHPSEKELPEWCSGAYNTQSASNCSLKKPINMAMKATGVHTKPQTDQLPQHQHMKEEKGDAAMCPRTADRKADLKCESCQQWASRNHSSKKHLIQCFKYRED